MFILDIIDMVYVCGDIILKSNGAKTLLANKNVALQILNSVHDN
jgi:hypothetical protein